MTERHLSGPESPCPRCRRSTSPYEEGLDDALIYRCWDCNLIWQDSIARPPLVTECMKRRSTPARVLTRLFCRRGVHLMRHTTPDKETCVVSCLWCGWTWSISGDEIATTTTPTHA